MRALELLIVLLALLGHLALWIYVFNRLHAVALPELVIEIVEKLIYAAVLAGFVGGGWLLVSGQSLLPPTAAAGQWWLTYFGSCSLVGLVVAGSKFRRESRQLLQRYYLQETSRVVSVIPPAGEPLCRGMITHTLAALPGNQIFDLEVTEKHFSLPTLPSALEGLSIAHVSDLHFTGKVRLPYFHVVIDELQAMQADLIVLTGDVLDTARCLDWIPKTLGRLSAPHGRFAVLGNHDRHKCDWRAVRRQLTDCGWIDLGGRSLERNICGERVLLSGNERPWFPAVEEPSELTAEPREFRILLSHSPDQIEWARRRQFDLMLAGHTHGGQIRLPWIGPIIAPSLYGVKYASGVFWESPTLMHVSRGAGGQHPVRFNCRPEISKIILHSADRQLPERSA